MEHRQVNVRPSRWGVLGRSGAEGGSEVFCQGVEVDVFAWEEGGVVAVELAPTLGGADVDPVGGSVAGARESVGVDKGLEQDGSVAVSGGPVVAETTGGASRRSPSVTVPAESSSPCVARSSTRRPVGRRKPYLSNSTVTHTETP